MQRVAGFIDAGYFWVQLSQQILGQKGLRSEIALDYDALHRSFLEYVSVKFSSIPLLRIYCYDGPSADGRKTYFHQHIEELNDFKLRLGSRTAEGGQKAVDGLIIADMISLTQNKAITHAFLVSGDADLVPGVLAAQSQGLRVHLLSLEPMVATSPYLKCEADQQKRWGIKEISRFAAKREPVSVVPAFVGNQPDFEVIAEKIFTELNSEQKALILGSYIPQDIDRRLLRAGLEAAGKALDEKQKRLMREVLLNKTKI
ncbi:MAG: NYN domain-containing protein [Treponema sp.]|jgi:uncharacterized LabA/DUF88 family protein|nr:NYN domain-containing protein [Treponema sp.]